jgi:hypothetical protein
VRPNQVNPKTGETGNEESSSKEKESNEKEVRPKILGAKTEI